MTTARAAAGHNRGVPTRPAVAERLDLGDGFALTRARPGDERWIAAAVEESFDHLHPWLEWATPERMSEAAQEARLPQLEHHWERGEEYSYLVRTGRDPRVLGAASLVRRAPATAGMPVWEIGYWTHVAWCRQGLATRSARALTELALSFPATDGVMIRCDEANAASASVPRALGYSLECIVDAPKLAPSASGRDMVWTLRRDPVG